MVQDYVAHRRPALCTMVHKGDLFWIPEKSLSTKDGAQYDVVSLAALAILDSTGTFLGKGLCMGGGGYRRCVNAEASLNEGYMSCRQVILDLNDLIEKDTFLGHPKTQFLL